MKRGQISFEYLILMGFVILVLGAILGIAFYYTGSVQDKIRISQINNFANKITATAESVYSSGQPSMATIKTYLPEGVQNVTIFEDTLVIEFKSSNGINKVGFPIDVTTSGMITATPGMKKLQFVATGNEVIINQA